MFYCVGAKWGFRGPVKGGYGGSPHAVYGEAHTSDCAGIAIAIVLQWYGNYTIGMAMVWQWYGNTVGPGRCGDGWMAVPRRILMANATAADPHRLAV